MKFVKDLNIYIDLSLDESVCSNILPKNFSPKVEVSSCFLEVGDKILFMKRNPKKSYGNTWGVPAGKIEKRENPKDAAIRETLEETGIVLSDVVFVKTVYVRYPEYDFIYHMFIVVLSSFPQIILNKTEHILEKWVTKEEALKMVLIPGGKECICIAYDL